MLFLPTCQCCLHKHPPGKASWKLAGIWHFPWIQQLFLTHSSSVPLPTNTFVSIVTQQKMKDQKPTGTLVQEWGEPELLSQSLTKGL